MIVVVFSDKFLLRTLWETVVELCLVRAAYLYMLYMFFSIQPFFGKKKKEEKKEKKRNTGSMETKKNNNALTKSTETILMDMD